MTTRNAAANAAAGMRSPTFVVATPTATESIRPHTMSGATPIVVGAAAFGKVLREAGEATKIGIPFEGHVPNAVTAMEAVNARQRSFEHFIGVSDTNSALIAALTRSKVWQAPTVINGVKCDQVAFRTARNDWQLWVTPGAQAIPCKYVITSRVREGQRPRQFPHPF